MLLSRYLLKELSATFLAVVLLLMAIFLSHRFAKYLAQAARGLLDGDLVFILLGFNIITSLVVLLPIAFFVANLLTFGRLYKDNEIVAMMACGVNQSQLLRPVMLMAGGLTLFVAMISLWIMPWAVEKIDAYRAQGTSIIGLSGVQPGRFKSFNNPDNVFYFEKYNQFQEMLAVFIHVKNPPFDTVVTAKRAKFSQNNLNNEIFLSLYDGFRIQGVPGQADYRISYFEQHEIRIDLDKPIFNKVHNKYLSTLSLWRSGDLSDKVELQWRLAMPLSVIILALIAVLMSRTTQRQGRFAKLFAALLVYLAYYNAIGIARTLTLQGNIPYQVGLWGVHALFFLIGLILLWHADYRHKFPLIPARWRHGHP